MLIDGLKLIELIDCMHSLTPNIYKKEAFDEVINLIYELGEQLGVDVDE